MHRDPKRESKRETTDLISPLHVGHCSTRMALQDPQLPAESLAFRNVHCTQVHPMVTLVRLGDLFFSWRIWDWAVASVPDLPNFTIESDLINKTIKTNKYAFSRTH